MIALQLHHTRRLYQAGRAACRDFVELHIDRRPDADATAILRRFLQLTLAPSSDLFCPFIGQASMVVHLLWMIYLTLVLSVISQCQA